MTDLLLLSKKLTAEWARSDEFAFEYHENGCINYYRTEKYEKGELETVRAGRDLGLDIRILSREEIHELEPELKPDVRGGAWYRDDAHLHPNSLMRELKSVLERKGVMIRTNTEVTGIEKKSGKINTLRLSDGSAWTGDLVVLAAGSWSREVARMAGEYLPVMPGKGYSMTVDVAHQPLKRPCILLEAKVAITPWEKKLRIGSTMEIGKVNDRILLPRVQGILEAVPKYLPGYTDDPAFREMSDLTKLKENLRSKVWYGFRPLSVDGLPYIGYAKKTSNLIIASGHAMLGLSFGAGTGKLVAELADGKPTSVGVEAFDPGRV
jgi:D-amino-acid dehydrogenase